MPEISRRYAEPRTGSCHAYSRGSISAADCRAPLHDAFSRADMPRFIQRATLRDVLQSVCTIPTPGPSS